MPEAGQDHGCRFVTWGLNSRKSTARSGTLIPSSAKCSLERWRVWGSERSDWSFKQKHSSVKTEQKLSVIIGASTMEGLRLSPANSQWGGNDQHGAVFCCWCSPSNLLIRQTVGQTHAGMDSRSQLAVKSSWGLPKYICNARWACWSACCHNTRTAVMSVWLCLPAKANMSFLLSPYCRDDRRSFEPIERTTETPRPAVLCKRHTSNDKRPRSDTFVLYECVKYRIYHSMSHRVLVSQI